MIKGIIFDFDGLILDTETPQYNVLRAIFTEHGSDLPLAFWQQQIGTHTGFSPFHYLEEQLQREIEHELLRARFKEEYHAKLALEKERNGVLAYLQAAKASGLKIGLASASGYNWVSKHLKNLGLFDYFECIRTADDVEKVKPDPALYLQAAECLGLQPSECLAFEDSANGALAAKRAGMSCVIVPNDMTHAMDFCEVEHRLQSMADMPLDELIEYVKTVKLKQPHQ